MEKFIVVFVVFVVLGFCQSAPTLLERHRWRREGAECTEPPITDPPLPECLSRAKPTPPPIEAFDYKEEVNRTIVPVFSEAYNIVLLQIINVILPVEVDDIIKNETILETLFEQVKNASKLLLEKLTNTSIASQQIHTRLNDLFQKSVVATSLIETAVNEQKKCMTDVQASIGGAQSQVDLVAKDLQEKQNLLNNAQSVLNEAKGDKCRIHIPFFCDGAQDKYDQAKAAHHRAEHAVNRANHQLNKLKEYKANLEKLAAEQTTELTALQTKQKEAEEQQNYWTTVNIEFKAADEHVRALHASTSKLYSLTREMVDLEDAAVGLNTIYAKMLESNLVEPFAGGNISQEALKDLKSYIERLEEKANEMSWKVLEDTSSGNDEEDEESNKIPEVIPSEAEQNGTKIETSQVIQKNETASDNKKDTRRKPETTNILITDQSDYTASLNDLGDLDNIDVDEWDDYEISNRPQKLVTIRNKASSHKSNTTITTISNLISIEDDLLVSQDITTIGKEVTVTTQNITTNVSTIISVAQPAIFNPAPSIPKISGSLGIAFAPENEPQSALPPLIGSTPQVPLVVEQQPTTVTLAQQLNTTVSSSLLSTTPFATASTKVVGSPVGKVIPNSVSDNSTTNNVTALTSSSITNNSLDNITNVNATDITNQTTNQSVVLTNETTTTTTTRKPLPEGHMEACISGDFHAVTTWCSTNAPIATDIVTIPENITVSVSANNSIEFAQMNIYGALRLHPTASLPVNHSINIIVFNGGLLTDWKDENSTFPNATWILPNNSIVYIYSVGAISTQIPTQFCTQLTPAKCSTLFTKDVGPLTVAISPRGQIVIFKGITLIAFQSGFASWAETWTGNQVPPDDICEKNKQCDLLIMPEVRLATTKNDIQSLFKQFSTDKQRRNLWKKTSRIRNFTIDDNSTDD